MLRNKLHQVANQDLQLTYTAITLGKELGITGKGCISVLQLGTNSGENSDT
ncbi:MAG: hypothetical protein F6J90_13675 [Moorea sp. SIOASIH]|uniref:hypothetical protein n=1 Tax=Moorena sp. SIOASIH TaxID=2607817 RepID=UPI0013B8D9E8|nr:hypothetical protein [Moorena sp. SIOASIH]NEO37315.1 hypothetical protein [Moorena sp. SIOASIH]